MAKTGSRLLLGTRKGLITLEHEDRRWRVTGHHHPGLSISYAFQDPRAGTLWACSETGHWGTKLFRSTDNGATWDQPPGPKYPEGAVVYDTWNAGPDGTPTKPATLKYLWVMTPGHASRPQTLFLGTEPGGLFRSEDGGENWELVPTLWNHPSREKSWFGGGRDEPGIHSIAVDPHDPDRMLVGISCAGVFETTNDGESWSGRNQGLRADFLPDPAAEYGHDPHFMAMCGADPNVLWQQNHCGIFRTADGGRQWKDVSQPEGPARFGFPIAADEQDPNVAWVVPAVSDEKRMAIEGGLCVCRTDDAGDRWTTFRAGLPQENCFDIVFRHGLDVAGDRLAFGSTTGNVYASSDRGENWECLGTGFPPVYSVRFARE